MLIEPEISGVSIVLLGDLNPKIFTPDWFARYDLLSGEEANAAEVEIIHQQVTKFRAGWLSLSVETNRFVAETTDHSIQLRDLVVRTFQEYLSHTPIGMLGINREMHFSVGSTEERDRIGFKLAPPDVWGDWASDIVAAEGNIHGGMRSLEIRQTLVKDRPRGYVQATVQPSAKIKNQTGIYVRVNDHYEIDDPGKALGCEEIIGFLAAKFDDSKRRSEWIIDRVMALKNA